MTKIAKPPFTKQHFVQHMRRKWIEKGFDLKRRKRIGVAISQIVTHATKRNSKVEAPYLDLWIAIFDEFVSWLLNLQIIFYAERKNWRKPTNFDRSITAILMKLIADSIAMRHLILAGYDVAARMLLRSIGEYGELYIAILDDPRLADEFVKSDTPEGAKKFWRSHIARGSLEKRVHKAWETWFHGREPETAAWFAAWGRQQHSRLSAMIHPSFAGGVFSALPMKTKHTKENWIGIWGDKGDGSVDTIYIFASFMFPIFLLHHEFPFKGFEAHLGSQIKFDESKEWHRHVKEGRAVLASLVMSLATHSNRKYIFPAYDMSIFKGATRTGGVTRVRRK